MLKKIIIALTTLLLSVCSWAVDVNRASQAELESVKGIGPKMAQSILAERDKGGPFKSSEDLAERVKGIGDKKLAALQTAGLTVGSDSPQTSKRK
jgi:competence protein ComEA